MIALFGVKEKDALLLIMLAMKPNKLFLNFALMLK